MNQAAASPPKKNYFLACLFILIFLGAAVALWIFGISDIRANMEWKESSVPVEAVCTKSYISGSSHHRRHYADVSYQYNGINYTVKIDNQEGKIKTSDSLTVYISPNAPSLCRTDFNNNGLSVAALILGTLSALPGVIILYYLIAPAKKTDFGTV